MSSRALAKRRAAERRGRFAEHCAMLWLMAKGYRILAHRARTPFGEVDLAALKDGALIVIEVKARATKLAGMEAIGAQQQARLTRAASSLARRWRLEGARMRFDLVIIGAGFWPIHVRGAWHLDKVY